MNQNVDNTRIIAKNIYMSNDCFKTKLNNNDLIIGPSGSGKTRGYVIPNLLHADESMIIADTKGNLYKKFAEMLRKKGFDVMQLNFNILRDNDCGYNPLRFIDLKDEQQIFNLAKFLISSKNEKDPFWENAARQYIRAFIPFIIGCMPKHKRNLATLSKMIEEMDMPESTLMKWFYHYIDRHPHSFSAREFTLISQNAPAAKMHISIKAIALEEIALYRFHDMESLFTKEKQIDFKQLGERKTVVFLNISDTNTSMYRLINLFYSQAFHELCNSADRDYEDFRLKVPVRFIFDDFATNTVIPNFQNIISVIRSRAISVSIIVQSLTQLAHLYGPENMATIVNNCDTLVYLGGQDIATAKLISEKINKTLYNVLTMSLNDVLVFIRGQEPKWTKRFDFLEQELEY